MADVLRPQFFVTRQNGAMVPLIAIDELPPALSLVDVPRELTPHDIHDMKGLGTHQSRHRRYIVERFRDRDHGSNPTVSRGLANRNSNLPSKRMLHGHHGSQQSHFQTIEDSQKTCNIGGTFDQQAPYTPHETFRPSPYATTASVSK